MAKSQGVIFTVQKIQAQGTGLVLTVSLVNQGKKPVEFLYSFLEVRDSNGQSLNVIADGLPQKVPGDGKTYQGNIEIPASVISDSDYISLNLVDYPDQNVNLSIDRIPLPQ